MPRTGFPAMIAAIRPIIAVQVTFLDPRGERKAPVATPRKTIGKLGSGAVRLGPPGDSLGLAEGVKTALSAMQLSGVAVWACLGSNRMAAVTIPDRVQFLDIFPDNDPAERAAMEKTMEEHRARLAARAQIPPEQFNDGTITSHFRRAPMHGSSRRAEHIYQATWHHRRGNRSCAASSRV